MCLSKVYDTCRVDDKLIMADVVSMVQKAEGIIIGNLFGGTVTAADRKIGEINFMDGYVILNRSGDGHDRA